MEVGTFDPAMGYPWAAAGFYLASISNTLREKFEIFSTNSNVFIRAIMNLVDLRISHPSTIYIIVKADFLGMIRIHFWWDFDYLLFDRFDVDVH